MSRFNGPVSKLVALLPEAAGAPTLHELERNLARGGLPVRFEQGQAGTCLALFEEADSTVAVDVKVRPTGIPAQHVQLARLSGSELDAALASRFCVSATCTPGDDVLDSLHAQLRVLAALAPDAVTMLDLNACDAKSGDWMRDAASASVPPGPTSFFTIHEVFEDEGRDRETWLHTHGLSRMGSIELDIVGARSDEASDLGCLINNVAKLLIDGGVPPGNTPFEAVCGLPLVWLPWWAALKHVSANPGGPNDRDADHKGPRGILLAPGARGKLESSRRYVSLLRKDPIIYLSPAETERMQRMARERLPRFLALQGRFAKSKDWEFGVKLGVPIDGDAAAESREHLWFDVHDATAETVDATLVNRPYAVASMSQGQRGTFDLRLLTDWVILSPRGKYTPETVLQLERGLANDVPARSFLH